MTKVTAVRSTQDLLARIDLLSGQITNCQDVLKALALRQERYNLQQEVLRRS